MTRLWGSAGVFACTIACSSRVGDGVDEVDGLDDAASSRDDGSWDSTEGDGTESGSDGGAPPDTVGSGVALGCEIESEGPVPMEPGHADVLVPIVTGSPFSLEVLRTSDNMDIQATLKFGPSVSEWIKTEVNGTPVGELVSCDDRLGLTIPGTLSIAGEAPFETEFRFFGEPPADGGVSFYVYPTWEVSDHFIAASGNFTVGIDGKIRADGLLLDLRVREYAPPSGNGSAWSSEALYYFHIVSP